MLCGRARAYQISTRISSGGWHQVHVQNVFMLLCLFLVRGLVEVASTQELGSPLNSSLSSLVCALCRQHPTLFSLLLASCQEAVEAQSVGVASLLHTLALASQSQECTRILLDSRLMAEVAERIYCCFSELVGMIKRLADKPSTESELDVLPVLEKACVNLAFLTDFCRNWKPAKDWVGDSPVRFWAPMVEFLSYVTPCVPPAVLTFCQEVAFEFFQSCLSQHPPNKQLFTRLLCGAIRGHFGAGEPLEVGEETRKPVLPLFLYRLLLDLVLRVESLPVVLTEQEGTSGEHHPVISTSSSSSLSPHSLPPLSLTHTHNSPEFHPSFPVGPHCFLLQLTALSSVADLEALCAAHQLLPGNPTAEAGKKPPPMDPTSNTLEIGKFDVRSWRFASRRRMPLRKPSKTELVFVHNSSELPTEAKLSSLRSEEDVPVLSVSMKHRPALPPPPPSGESSQPAPLATEQPETPLPHATPSLLDLFIELGGLQPLADCLPSLYPYHWPEGTREMPRPLSMLKSHSMLLFPSSIPLHSALMLGMCLSLRWYGDVVGTNPEVAYTLLRVLLGASTKGVWCVVSRLFLGPTWLAQLY